MSNLPLAGEQELIRSNLLKNYIFDQIAESGGWIPFSQYMQLALYTPRLGYYSSSRQKFGYSGDFITAPELTPLFAQTLARQIAELLPHCANSIYEFGAGSGILAVDLLLELERLGVQIDSYKIIELSADLIKSQRALIERTSTDLLKKISWLSSLPDEISGIIIGNELLDAMPCELINWQHKQILQRGVSLANNEFIWQDKNISNNLLFEIASEVKPKTDYLSEINLLQRAFINSLGKRLQCGAILFFDYGFPRHEFYHAQRKNGTLIGHYLQHVVHDPFFLPGLLDLTSHVDFSAIAEAGINASLDLIGYTSQAQFLINCGITQVLENSAEIGSKNYIANTSNVQKLLSCTEMGELFKVIAFARNMPVEWTGFLCSDRCHTL